MLPLAVPGIMGAPYPSVCGCRGATCVRAMPSTLALARCVRITHTARVWRRLIHDMLCSSSPGQLLLSRLEPGIHTGRLRLRRVYSDRKCFQTRILRLIAVDDSAACIDYYNVLAATAPQPLTEKSCCLAFLSEPSIYEASAGCPLHVGECPNPGAAEAELFHVVACAAGSGQTPNSTGTAQK